MRIKALFDFRQSGFLRFAYGYAMDILTIEIALHRFNLDRYRFLLGFIADAEAKQMLRELIRDTGTALEQLSSCTLEAPEAQWI